MIAAARRITHLKHCFVQRMKYLPVFLFVLLCLNAAQAQQPAKPSAADLHQRIKKLNVLGSVLYVAAHPDDENQRFISYCANHKLFDVTYLSLTRGDGGQNLIGPEIRELLGVLRTEELLMARSIDGGKQRFSRANDFGFSKSPDETMAIWNKDEVLSDVVWAIRQTQPDVIVNRFYHDKKYDTHGHHTASAMLSVEAFDLAGKSDAYAEQLKYTQAWQARRIFFNTSWWFFGSRENFEKTDKSKLFPIDLGVFLPLKGKSNAEVAAEARSMHRCQGFGAMSSRGESTDWFDFIKGERPATQDMFEGINTTWTRVTGGEKIGKLLAKVDANFRSDNPAASVPDLLKAMEMIKALPDGYWKRLKLEEIKTAIQGCLGLYLEATAAEPGATSGQMVKLRLEATNQAGSNVQLNALSIQPALFDTVTNLTLATNKAMVLERQIRLPLESPFTAPYWLRENFNLGMYTVPDQAMRGQPESPRQFRVRWNLSVNGTALELETPVAYKIEESAIGEVWRPFEVLPPAFVEFDQPSYLFTGNKRSITVRVKAGRDSVSARVSVQAPGKGWVNASGTQTAFFKKKGEIQTFNFEIQAGTGEVKLGASVEVDGKIYTNRLVNVAYPHIPQQSVLLPCEVQAARADVQVKAPNVGYYMGAGDDIPNALRQMGCTVTMLEEKDFAAADNLRAFDAIVLGVRAYNAKENIAFHQAKLFEYVQGGGTLVTQYNTSFELYVNNVAPYPMKLGRARVTDEKAEMRLTDPAHPVFNFPNKLGAADFEGWVQERGLYFASEWDKAFAAPLSCNDPGEKANSGGLLIAPYGKGQFVYTGLSFFRQLPSGVPGAYRLFANIISLGKSAGQ